MNLAGIGLVLTGGSHTVKTIFYQTAETTSCFSDSSSLGTGHPPKSKYFFISSRDYAHPVYIIDRKS